MTAGLATLFEQAGLRSTPQGRRTQTTGSPHVAG
jgi:hypothetical protein